MILVDSRQGSKELLRFFPKDIAQLATLEYGDFSFVGNGPEGVPWLIGIERKTVSDFLNSMCTGRLSGHQLIGLVNSYNIVYLVVEGYVRFDLKTDKVLMRYGARWVPATIGSRTFTCKEVYGFLNSLMISAGVNVVFVLGKYDTVSFIKSTYHWWNKGKFENHKSHLARHQASISLIKQSYLRRVASELPGISYARSGKVENHFGSIHAMVNATVEDWMKMPGIGRTIAEAVVEEINRNHEQEYYKY